jgi:hypothetical protein
VLGNKGGAANGWSMLPVAGTGRKLVGAGSASIGLFAFQGIVLPDSVVVPGVLGHVAEVLPLPSINDGGSIGAASLAAPGAVPLVPFDDDCGIVELFDGTGRDEPPITALEVGGCGAAAGSIP